MSVDQVANLSGKRLSAPFPSPELPEALIGLRTLGAVRSKLTLGNWLRGYKLGFLLCVVLPTLCVGVYLGFVAPKEYVTESKFVIRTAGDEYPSMPISVQGAGAKSGASSSAPIAPSSNPAGSASKTLGSLSAGGGLFSGGHAAASQDAYIVADYIRGRTIIEDIGGQEVLHRIYARSGVDWLSGLGDKFSLEEAWNYWTHKVGAIIDTQSNIISLTVRAFEPRDAYDLSQKILKQCEALVNDMSERSRKDSLERAESEIKKAQDRLVRAQQALLEFRNSANSVDPMSSATSLSGTIFEIIRDKIALEAQRDSLRGIVAANSPTRKLLDAQIEAKDKQIAQLKEQLTSKTRSDTISSQIAKFESLELESTFAQNLYAAAQSAYQTARLRLERQQLYLAPILRPTVPEVNTYPQVFTDTALFFAVFLVLWSMISLLIAAVRDHVDYG